MKLAFEDYKALEGTVDILLELMKKQRTLGVESKEELAFIYDAESVTKALIDFYGKHVDGETWRLVMKERLREYMTNDLPAFEALKDQYADLVREISAES